MTDDRNQDQKTFLSDSQYNAVKFLTVIALPALGTLYFALAQIWGLPKQEEVLGTLLAIQAFIGALMHISTNQYEQSGAKYSGTITTSETGNKLVYSLEMNHDPELLQQKREALFKVSPEKAPS